MVSDGPNGSARSDPCGAAGPARDGAAADPVPQDRQMGGGDREVVLHCVVAQVSLAQIARDLIALPAA